MTNEIASLKKSIGTLWEAYEVLSAEKDALIEKYERPTQWHKDKNFVQICKEREGILDQINKLNGNIQDIKEAKIFSEKSWEQ